MNLVVIESPHAGATLRNKAYLLECITDSIRRGENPYASHYMLPHFLDDDKPQERQLGIEMGFQWGSKADKVVFYIDLGMSRGMVTAYNHWVAMEKPIEMRRIKS